ncbi:MAG: diguanylate cyclase [Pseudomonadota bacterium]
MTDNDAAMFSAVLDLSSEPIAVVRVDQPGWPITYANPSFSTLLKNGDRDFEVVLDALLERGAAISVSEALRSRSEARMPVQVGGQSFLLELNLLAAREGYCAVVLHRDNVHQLRTRPKSAASGREDPVTGLLTEQVFREVLQHDWSVARREHTRLGLLFFRIEDFPEYAATFGDKSANTCLKRVGQAIRRCLRRASDLVARIGDDAYVVLSHAPDAPAVEAFAEGIAASVRDLKLHHPKSSAGKFVTVASHVVVVEPADDERSVDALVDELIS